MKSPIALIDANNFFVSCERLFRPDLERKPVLVLSSNDGCVIARSNEVKHLGIPMGAPYFTVREQCTRAGITVFSSNFDLYRDLSRRVLEVLRQEAADVEAYSVDEAFVTFPRSIIDASTSAAAWHTFGTRLRLRILREVGIPVTVGIAPTKTLSKVATHVAKELQKRMHTPKEVWCGTPGVCVLTNEEAIRHATGATPIGEVWGIGYREAPRLVAGGITTASALRAQPDAWVRATLRINGLRTVHELRSRVCFPVGEVVPQRKSLMHTRSFGRVVYEYRTVHAAVAYHARKVAEVLRAEGVRAAELGVMIRTSRHRSDVRYAGYADERFVLPTNDTLTLTRMAGTILRRIYRPQVPYTKAGVVVRGITAEANEPSTTLFGEASDAHRPLMQALDTLRHRFGDVLYTGSEEPARSWEARHGFRSPRYTTEWREVPSVRHTDPS